MDKNGVITIKFVEGKETTPGPQPITPQISGEEPVEKSVQASETSALQTAVYTTMIQSAAKQLKGMMVNEAKFQINRYFNLTDNYMAKQEMDIALGVINRTYSIGSAIVGGAIAGSAGGPAGIVLGAAIATGMSGLSLGLDIYHNYSEQDIRIRKMDNSLDFNRQRAGYSLTAGARGENK